MSLIPLGFWAASGGGAGGPAFDLLESEILTSSASVTFTGLGAYSDYKHLQLRIVGGVTTTGGFLNNFRIRLNSDSGVNYYTHQLQGDGSSVASSGFSFDSIQFHDTLARDSLFGALVIDILDFSSTSKNTTLRGLGGGTNTSENNIGLYSGLWVNTNAVTELDLYDTYKAGSRFSLYGVK